MDIEKLIKKLRSTVKLEAYYNSEYNGLYNQAADTLEKLQAENEKLHDLWSDASIRFEDELDENEKLRAELERVKRERDAAVGCIYQIEDDLDRGSDNDWARSEWESQKGG